MRKLLTITALEWVNSNLDLKCFIESSREKFHVSQCIPWSQQYFLLKPEMRFDECQEQHDQQRSVEASRRCYFFIICEPRSKAMWKGPRANIETVISNFTKHCLLLCSIASPVSGYGLLKGEIEREAREKGSSRRLAREKRAPDNKESLSFSFREKWSPKGASKEVIKSKIC